MFAQTPQRTMAELMAALRARLGFVTSGPNAQSNAEILESTLRSAHEAVMLDLGIEHHATRTAWLACKAGEALYDFHDDAADAAIDAGTISRIALLDPEQPKPAQPEGAPPNSWQNQSRERRALKPARQIPAHDEYGEPTMWGIDNGQIRLWPIPIEPWRLAITHATPARFSQPTDRTQAPDELVLSYALALAKAHYRQPDAQVYLSAYQNQLATHRSRRHLADARYFHHSTAAIERGAPSLTHTPSGHVLQF